MLKIVYHHIPKCGGTSILRGMAFCYYPLRLLTLRKKGFPGILDAQASSADAEKNNLDLYSYRRQLLERAVNKDNSPLVFGHYPFSEKVYEDNKDNWKFVSLFRSPLERWYSEYYWNRYKDHEYAKTDLDIEAYFDSKQGMMNTRSFVNYFSNAKNPESIADVAEAELAIKNIDKLDVVGTVENMNNFRSSLKESLGRKPYFFKLNKSPAREEDKVVPDEKSEFHKKLENALQADQYIYDHVLKRAAQNKH